MAKLILMSPFVATLAIPLYCARDKSAHRGLKRTMFALLVFNAAYIAMLIYGFIPLSRALIESSFGR